MHHATRRRLGSQARANGGVVEEEGGAKRTGQTRYMVEGGRHTPHAAKVARTSYSVTDWSMDQCHREADQANGRLKSKVKQMWTLR